jgi:hypothetical protein
MLTLNNKENFIYEWLPPLTMTYVHGLGDAQENMIYYDDTPKEPKCSSCGCETEYDSKDRDGTYTIYTYICVDEDCETENTIEEDLDDDY